MDVNIADLEPKNVDLLRRYVTDEGRILPRKYTGFPAGHQRQLTRAIKRASNAVNEITLLNGPRTSPPGRSF